MDQIPFLTEDTCSRSMRLNDEGNVRYAACSFHLYAAMQRVFSVTFNDTNVFRTVATFLIGYFYGCYM